MTYRPQSPFAYPEVRWDNIGVSPQIRETAGIARVVTDQPDPDFKPRPVGFTARVVEVDPLVWEGDNA